jgi:hypothetical protein
MSIQTSASVLCVEAREEDGRRPQKHMLKWMTADHLRRHEGSERWLLGWTEAIGGISLEYSFKKVMTRYLEARS